MSGPSYQTVTFYSFKGGVGRTVCASHVAWALARERYRIAIVDLDLAAPSLWSLLSPRREPAPGFLEYLTRGAGPVEDLIEAVPLDPSAKGALFLLQAGAMDADYLGSLETFDWRQTVPGALPSGEQLHLYQRRASELLDEMAERLALDAVFLDAPTGFGDTSNVCLRGLADLVVAIFAPNRVQVDGVGRVVAAVEEDRLSLSPPDLLCVASTLMHSRLGGSLYRSLERAFQFLREVRYRAIGSPETLSPEDEDRISPPHAVLHYDERLASVEELATEREPGKGYFSSFEEVLDYVRGALPETRREVSIPLDHKRVALDELEACFQPFAEHEGRDRLLEHFLRTSQVESAEDPLYQLVLGGKGAGKTALFTYWTTRQPEEFLPAHGPGAGMPSDRLCRLFEGAPQDVVWRAYLLSRMEDLPASLDGDLVSLLEELRHLSDGSRDSSPLADVLERLNAPDLPPRVDDAWRQLDGELVAAGRTRTLCLDALETCFKSNVELRDRALEGLFVGLKATFAGLEAIRAKVFLRRDIWERLSFPEKSHVQARSLRLAWDPVDLWKLLVKRAFGSTVYRELCETTLATGRLDPRGIEPLGEKALHPYLDLLFQRTIWAGKNSLSRNWILRRLTDASGTTFPRDVLTLLQEAVRKEVERLRDEDRVTQEALLSRQSLSQALDPTSAQRLQAVREEYPELDAALDRLRGENAQGSRQDMIRLLGAGSGEDDEEAGERTYRNLEAAGVLGTNPRNPDQYQVPDLYRLGLGMPRRGPR